MSAILSPNFRKIRPRKPIFVNQIFICGFEDVIKLPDAIILASALVNNCILVTRNTDDFTKFSDIATLLDPFAI